MWTSVHGDFHPNQCVWSKSLNQIYFFDFEDVGFWNPTIDLVNFMITLPTEFRRKHQQTFLKTYFDRLREFSQVPNSYTFKKLMNDFKTHGAGRTIRWMLLFYMLWGEKAFNFTCTQVEPFLKDFNVDIHAVPMPPFGFDSYEQT